MLRPSSLMPVNSTNPRVIQDVLERQSALPLHHQSVLSKSQTIADSFKFMIPSGQLFSSEELPLVNPQPRLKSLIKLEHLLRPSPSFRLGGPRRVASAPSPIVHGFDEEYQYNHANLKDFHANWRQSTPRNRIVSIRGLKTRFPAQLSDSEIDGESDDFSSESASSEDKSRYRRRDSSASSSSSSMSSIPLSSERSKHSSIKDSKLHEKRIGSKGENLLSSPKNIQKPLLYHKSPERDQLTSNREASGRVEEEESQGFKSSIPHGIRAPRLYIAHQHLNISTDSHPHRRSRRKPISPPLSTTENEVKRHDFHIKNLPGGLLASTPGPLEFTKLNTIEKVLRNKPGIHTISPTKKDLGNQQASGSSPRDKLSNFPTRQPERSRTPLARTTRPNSSLKESQVQAVGAINTKGLSAFIRSVKYGILQLVPSSHELEEGQVDGHLHIRLWINNHSLPEPIPGNLISISPTGDKIEIFNTHLEVSETSTSEELNQSFHQARRKVLFYSLDVLPIQIRVIYDYLRKFLMIMLGGVPRAVFQLHTFKFQQRVRCAIMMNGPGADLEVEWCDENIKIKVSKSRGKIRVWNKNEIIYQDQDFNHLDNQNLSQRLIKILSEIFESKIKREKTNHINNVNGTSREEEDFIHLQKLEKFQDWLDFIHPCLKISDDIQKTLDKIN